LIYIYFNAIIVSVLIIVIICYKGVINITLKQLRNRIEQTREELHELSRKKELDSNKILTKSRELDELLNLYNENIIELRSLSL
jgi:uncharacterized membrane protein (DUF106 family)